MQTNRSPNRHGPALTAESPDDTLNMNMSDVFISEDQRKEAEVTTLTRPLDQRPCMCGARLDDGQTLCRKCRARERWHRRSRLRRDNQRRTDAHRTAMLLGGAR